MVNSVTLQHPLQSLQPWCNQDGSNSKQTSPAELVLTKGLWPLLIERVDRLGWGCSSLLHSRRSGSDLLLGSLRRTQHSTCVCRSTSDADLVATCGPQLMRYHLMARMYRLAVVQASISFKAASTPCITGATPRCEKQIIAQK